MTLDQDPDALPPMSKNVCGACNRPIDDHCLKHGVSGYMICPDRDGKTPCQLTGPAHIGSYA